MTKGIPKISVLLPTYRQPEILILTLRDLSKQKYPDNEWELLLFDDGSNDDSTKTALLVVPNSIIVTIKRQPQGGKYSHAQIFNELIRLANPESNIFIHVEDTRIRPDFLSQHAKWHQHRTKYLVTGPMCEGPNETFNPSDCDRWSLMQMSGKFSKAYYCCFQAIFAKSMSYSRGLLEDLMKNGDPAPFDVRMSGWGYHETEFALRAERAGAICVYDTECAVFHPTHNYRDEIEYRGIDRSHIQSQGTASNIDYLCRKHGLIGLPNWKVGEPIESLPPAFHLREE